MIIIPHGALGQNFDFNTFAFQQESLQTSAKPFVSLANKKQQVISDITDKMNEEMEAKVRAKERNQKVLVVLKTITGIAGFGMLGLGSWYSYDAQQSIDEQKKISDEYYSAKLGTDFEEINTRFHAMDAPIQTKVDRSRQFLGYGAGILLLWGFMLYAF